VPRNMFDLVWPFTWPARFYLRKSPFAFGKARVRECLDALIRRTTSGTFEARLPGNRTATLQFSEVIGRTFLIHGGFEVGESQLLRELALPDTTAVDVGANVGLLSIPLSDSVGNRGRVWAFEPIHATADRLRGNLTLNNITNVEVFELAVTDAESEAVLNVADDPAYHSLAVVYEGRGTGQQITVRTTKLDSIWIERGAPAVSVIKVDTEGTEAAVVSGASALIEACRPVLVVEATSPEATAAIAARLEPHGYSEAVVQGLQSATRVFMPEHRLQTTEE
jgi:FkbM family methyltransferase